MKISSNGTLIGCYFSLDKENWQMVKLYENYYPDTIFVGLHSQAPKSDGHTATFEDVTFTNTAISDFRMGV